jgi:hypothetical protein
VTVVVVMMMTTMVRLGARGNDRASQNDECNGSKK